MPQRMLHDRVPSAVYDPRAPSSVRAVDELQKRGVRPALIKLARWWTVSDADAEDLVYEALDLACDPDRSPWDPAARGFLKHMRYLMRDLAGEEARSSRARHEVVDARLARDDAMVDGDPLPDDALEAHRERARLQRLGDQLLARMASDPIAMEVYRVAKQGFETPAEQAEHLEYSIDQINEAHRRMKYHARQIRTEEEQAEASRMRERRETPAAEPPEVEP
jgi:hypothetical protein